MLHPLMTETVYSSESELLHPRRFFSAAGEDLRRAPAAALRLFSSNVQARHRRAWLGYLWLLLPTIGTSAVWVYMQSRRIIAVAPPDVPYPVYVLAGMILWQVFAEALVAPLQQLTAGKQMITRSRVPHEALILAGLFEVLLNAAVRLLLLAAVLVAFEIRVSAAVLLVPIGVAALALFGLTVGLFATPLGMLYDDVGRALAVLSGFWFFLTPVLYRTPPDGLLRFNPVAPLLDTTRAWLTGGRMAPAFTAVTSVTVAALILAWLLQRVARPHVVARL